MRNRIVECRKVEVPHPSGSASIVFPDLSLKGNIGVLPATKEENAVGLLQDIAEDHLELKRGASTLHLGRCKVRKRLQDYLVLNIK